MSGAADRQSRGSRSAAQDSFRRAWDVTLDQGGHLVILALEFYAIAFWR